MNKPLSLYEFIVLNFPYAIHLNPNSEFSADELKMATRILEADKKSFNEDDLGLILMAFACLIRSIKASKKQLEKWDEKQFQKKGDSWKQYHKMIPEFNRVMQSFCYGINSQLAHGEKIFPITEVIFKGDLKERIVLSGHILDIIRAMFVAFDKVYSKEDKEKMKQYSRDLYEEYEEFMLQWQVLNADGGTIASQLVKNRELSRKQTAINKYKYSIAYNVHIALKGLTKGKASTAIPALHKKIIGRLLNEVGLFDYYGNVSNSDVKDLILQGNPNFKKGGKEPKK